MSAPRSLACPPRYNVHTIAAGLDDRARQPVHDRRPAAHPVHRPRPTAGRTSAATGTADLICRDGRWWLHIVVTCPLLRSPATDDVIGVDLGMAQPAVTSTGRFLGKKAVAQRRGPQLQAAPRPAGQRARRAPSAAASGSRRKQRGSAATAIMSSVEADRAAAPRPAATIVVENLTNIRARVKTRRGTQARRIHGWSFDQCRQFIEYKAEERGVTVAGVDPRHTSQRCSRCGHTARNNRRSRSLSSVVSVATHCLPTSTGRSISRPSTVPVSVDLMLASRPSTGLSWGKSTWVSLPLTSHPLQGMVVDS